MPWILTINFDAISTERIISQQAL